VRGAAYHGGKKYLGSDDRRHGFGVDGRWTEQGRQVKHERKRYHAAAEARAGRRKTRPRSREARL